MIKPTNWTEIAARVESRRKELKFSKKSMAEFLNVSVKTYTEMEQGKREFSIREMQGLCLLLHFSPEYFLTGKMGMLECCELIRNVQEVEQNERDVAIGIAQYLHDTSNKRIQT